MDIVIEVISKDKFGERIRKSRLEKRISLRKFANQISISPTYLSRIERGDFDPPSEKTIKKIAQALDFNIDELLSCAGKISSDISEIIMQRPIVAKYLRNVVAHMSDIDLKNFVK